MSRNPWTTWPRSNEAEEMEHLRTQVADLLAALKASKHYDNAVRDVHYGREYAEWMNLCDVCAAIATAKDARLP